jgi:hypothetical protein
VPAASLAQNGSGPVTAEQIATYPPHAKSRSLLPRFIVDEWVSNRHVNTDEVSRNLSHLIGRLLACHDSMDARNALDLPNAILLGENSPPTQSAMRRYGRRKRLNSSSGLDLPVGLRWALRGLPRCKTPVGRPRVPPFLPVRLANSVFASRRPPPCLNCSLSPRPPDSHTESLYETD